MWENASPVMQSYVCHYADRAPSWCERLQAAAKTYGIDEAEVFGPVASPDDLRWLDLLENGDPRDLSRDDIAFIHQRAKVGKDPQAMEILGYLYSQGLGVERDFAESYLWYGQALLAGEHHVRENMDAVWTLLVHSDRVKADQLARQFSLPENGQNPAIK